ncbi:MAG: MunI family type II restriction endonuclease [Planctomycetaceae bacterium]|nr:MunI family type II restriction endonuclease [Planctomycetaceae bacterium]
MANAKRSKGRKSREQFFTPGLLKILRQYGKLGDGILPFWVVFQGDITRDPKRVREITLWYEKYPEHFFMWYDNADETPLVEHFNKHFKDILLGKKQ